MDIDNLFNTQEYYAGQGSGHDNYAGQGSGQGSGGNQEFYTGQDYSMGQGSAYGSAPIEDDSPVEEVATPVKGKKVSKRRQKTVPTENKKSSKPWTTEEEVALCQAWCDVSENNITGNAMKSRGFWLKVIEYFEIETGSNRGYDAILSKWKKSVRPRIDAFCVILIMSTWKQVEMPLFCSKQNSGSKKAKTSETTGSAQGGLNLNEEADGYGKEPINGRASSQLDVEKKKEQQQCYIDLKNQKLNIHEKGSREASELKRQELEIKRFVYNSTQQPRQPNYQNRPFSPPYNSQQAFYDRPSYEPPSPSPQSNQGYSLLNRLNLDMDIENLFNTQEYYAGQGSGHDNYVGQGSGKGSGGNQEFYAGQDYSMGQGLAHGSAPIEDDSPVEEVATAVKAKKVSKRRQKTVPTENKKSSKPWTTEEEVALCQAWCDMSENSITETLMKNRGYLASSAEGEGLFDMVADKWKSLKSVRCEKKKG
ncbi:hypothetical protein Tco_1039340 [Tanacetum coccineum]